MDQNFQTSFIPKKPVIEERIRAERPIGLFLIIAIFIFLTVALTSGGLYFYKSILSKKIISMENDLNLAKNRFEPARIEALQVLDKRLRASTEILSNHIAVSPIFKILEDVTMKTVRFTKFEYVFAEGPNAKVEVKMSGQAIGYRSVALQSDLFTEHKEIIDPVFSNLSLDDRGNVLFDLEFSVDPTFVDYRQMLQTESEGNLNTIPEPEGMGPVN